MLRYTSTLQCGAPLRCSRSFRCRVRVLVRAASRGRVDRRGPCERWPCANGVGLRRRMSSHWLRAAVAAVTLSCVLSHTAVARGPRVAGCPLCACTPVRPSGLQGIGTDEYRKDIVVALGAAGYVTVCSHYRMLTCLGRAGAGSRGGHPGAARVRARGPPPAVKRWIDGG